MIKQPLMRFTHWRFICLIAVACTLLLSCGLTAFAAEEGSADKPATEPTPTITAEPTTNNNNGEIAPEPSTPPLQADVKKVLYLADVQTIFEDGARRIIKTYVLTVGESPSDIPRDSFERDGWKYTLTDITQKKTSGTDTRPHIETVEINTDSKDLNDILTQLSPVLEFESEDGYSGLITLDLASVKCEAAGYKNSSYTLSATREYPHLSTNDLSLIPKTITDGGKTLALADVKWETQHSVNVDYQDVPDSYRAVAKYTANASKSVVTGYVTTASYTGEIAKVVTGDTIYTAYFSGSEINPAPKTPESTATPTPTASADTPQQESMPGNMPIIPIIVIAAIAAVLGGLGAFFFLRHNVKVYRVNDSGRQLVAKVRISPKNPTIDLTPLSGHGDKHFTLDIERFAAKSLNGKMVEVIFGPARLTHKIAYEGNVYKLDVDFHSSTITAIY